VEQSIRLIVEEILRQSKTPKVFLPARVAASGADVPRRRRVGVGSWNPRPPPGFAGQNHQSGHAVFLWGALCKYVTRRGAAWAARSHQGLVKRPFCLPA